MTKYVKVTDEAPVASLVLARPEKRNALNGPMVLELLDALQALARGPSQVVMIAGQGEHFCAGGDIAWMQQIVAGPSDANYEDAQSLADLLFMLYHFPKPTIVLAHGATMGGGMGLLAAADIVIAAKKATFGYPEVKIGLSPSMISPYAIHAIGERWARYYFLTGETFTVETAHRLGLVHQISEHEALFSTGTVLAHALLLNGPKALRASKELIREVISQPISAGLSQKTAEHLAELRTTPEAQEGLRAFLEKRRPNWCDYK